MNVRGASIEHELAHWKEALKGAPHKLELPTDSARPSTQSLRRASESFVVPEPLVDQLKALASAEGTTLPTVLGASFLLLLHRYSGQDDLLAGAFVDGAAPLVWRSQVTDALTVRRYLRALHAWHTDAQAHASAPLEAIVDALVPKRDASHAPLCQVTFVHGGEAAKLERDTASSDLTLFVSETAGGVGARIAYASDLFTPSTMQRLCGHLGALLEAIARDADQRVVTLPMLTERERTQLLYEWNQTAVEIPRTTAHRLFEAAVKQHPDRLAVSFEGSELTYLQLNERANQIAHHLRRRGVDTEHLVGVCMDRVPELVIALLGVWKAGAAYVPLDPSHPPERLSFMLKDAGARVLLTDEAHRPLFATDGVPTICVDSDGMRIAEESTDDPDDVQVGPQNLAYVMYTSGSTGQPKGVMVLHHGLVNYLKWAVETYRPDSGDAVPVHSSIAFDLTVTALFVPLVGGGRVELIGDEVGGQKLVACLKAGRDRSLVKITPAHLQLLSDALGPEGVPHKTNLFVIGGENLTAESLSLWREFAPSTRLINEYGPTETVVGCCVHEVRPTDPKTGSVCIGKPIANTQLYVLDRHLNPLPLGAVGELYIGGAGVARGYLNRPELTNERFLPDPFAREKAARMYKTGDLARWRTDGTLEYLGRVDNQVKVRGYRIELGEIEAQLADHPQVKSCAVLAREDTPGNKQLVGYLVAKSERPTVDDVRRHLREKLPEYMVPTAFVFLDEMPLTHNGKVDRKALPAPSLERVAASTRPVAPPRTAIEQRLVGLWRELLNVENVGVDDNFFELGGHSLLAIKAVSRIRELFEVELPAQAVIDDPTVAAIARTISQHKGVVGRPEVKSGPFFLGEPSLFAVYHSPPADAQKSVALLVCGSIGHEHTRGYRAIAGLCESAARAGVASLRFDYRGVGDSAGELAEASVDHWLDDVDRALDELVARSGARELHLVGLRLGAAVAAAALKRGRAKHPVKSLRLWDPLLSGGEFLQHTDRFHALFLRDAGRFSTATLRRRSPRSGDPDFLLGYRYPPTLRRSLETLDLRSAGSWPSLPVRAIFSEPSPVESTLKRLGSADRSMNSDIVKGAPAAWDDYALHEKTLRAGPITARIVDELAGSRS